MSAGLVHFHQMTLLRGGQLGLLATQMTFGFGHLHPLARSSADEIGFELCHHRQNIEEKPPHWVGRVMDGSADAELDAFDGEFVHDVFRVPKRARQPVKSGND